MAVLEEPKETLQRRLLYRGLPAVALALLINSVMLAALATMNQLALPDAASPPPPMTVLLHPMVEPMEEQQPEPEPEQEVQPQVMQVSVELPTPELPPMEPLDLDLSLDMPTVSPVRVAVKQRRAEPRPVAAVKPQPAPSAPAAAKPKPRGPQRVMGIPRQLAGDPPRYPRSEQRRGVEGTVTAEILLAVNGQVKEVRFTGGRSAFRREVERVIDSYRFEPVVVDGQRVEAWFVMPFRFVLEGR